MLNAEEINQKLDTLESDMERLVAENDRLIRERESVLVQADSWVGMFSQLCIKNNIAVGLASETVVAFDLPSGQVTWEFGVGEKHLFENLPKYTKELESIDVQENYRRIMNPGF